MPTYLRRPEGQKTRATSLADLPKVIDAAPVTEVGEASLDAIAVMLDAPPDSRRPALPAVCELLVRATPSRAQADRLAMVLMHACATLDRCRVLSRDARTRLLCETWTARAFSALRCAERMLETAEQRISRYDAVDCLLSALFAVRAVFSDLIDEADCGALKSAATDGFVCVVKALHAEAMPVTAEALA